jgi:hypothetical protein
MNGIQCSCFCFVRYELGERVCTCFDILVAKNRFIKKNHTNVSNTLTFNDNMQLKMEKDIKFYMECIEGEVL